MFLAGIQWLTAPHSGAYKVRRKSKNTEFPPETRGNDRFHQQPIRDNRYGSFELKME
jgi:hypothetical protein